MATISPVVTTVIAVTVPVALGMSALLTMPAIAGKIAVIAITPMTAVDVLVPITAAAMVALTACVVTVLNAMVRLCLPAAMALTLRQGRAGSDQACCRGCKCGSRDNFTQQYTVRALPSARELDRIAVEQPDSRTEVLDALNQRLPGEMQDGQSFRYGVINLGGRDRHDILTALRDCLQHLTLRLEPV